MLETIRTHRRLLQFLLLLFIIPSFALFGLESYKQFGNDGNVVAKVGSQKITKEELDAAQREQAERFRQMFGGQFDAKMLDTPEARQGILEGLISQRALALEAEKRNLTVPDQTLQQTILSIPGLTNAEGKFDGEQYKTLLAMQGLTPQMYEARLRRDLSIAQVNAAVQSSAFTPKTVADRLSDLNDQERTVQEVVFKNADFVSQVKVTDEMLKAYYDKHASAFEVPEQIKAQYVVFDSAAIASQIAVSDADVQSYYEQNRKRYATEEQRRASHILIAVKKDAPAADKSAAKAKAETLLAQARKNPDDFARLAKENSQDPGSAERGGDLDFFSKGMMAPAFEATVFKLKQGEISDLVETEFGYHIIKLTGIKPAAEKPLADVKADIVADIRKQQAAKRFSEQAEQFTNTVYEQSDSLKPVADKLNLKIETAEHLTRTPAPNVPPDAPINNAKFLAALFSDEVVKNKRNTEAIEVGPNKLISGRVLEYKPVTKRPFEEVKSAIQERVVQEQAAELAKKAGEARLAELKAKPDADMPGAAKAVSRVRNDSGVPDAAATAIMKADTSKLPAFVGVTLPDSGYAVYRISKVSQPATVDTARRQAEQQQIAGALGQQEAFSYVESLKKKAKVEIHADKLKPADTSGN